jgi:hypothetical protein
MSLKIHVDCALCYEVGDEIWLLTDRASSA